jgi:hypothetical protein
VKKASLSFYVKRSGSNSDTECAHSNSITGISNASGQKQGTGTSGEKKENDDGGSSSFELLIVAIILMVVLSVLFAILLITERERKEKEAHGAKEKERGDNR